MLTTLARVHKTHSRGRESILALGSIKCVLLISTKKITLDDNTADVEHSVPFVGFLSIWKSY